MYLHLLLGLLCVFFAHPVHAGVPQELVYHNDEEDAGEGASANANEGDLTAPPPVLRTQPSSVNTTGPMGSSPLTPAPVQSTPLSNPIPNLAPVIIAAPVHEDAVEKGELAAPVLTYYGVLDERSGSLPMDAWKSLSYHDAVGVLTNATQRVSSGNGSSILNDTLRVAALSKTYEPSGTPELAPTYFNARVLAAQATGDRDGALALLRARPENFKLADWQGFIENEIRQRRFNDVCAISADKLAQDISPFAQKVSILCDIKGGKADTARLHLDLLREANDGDAVYLELAERALNPNVTPKTKQALKLENLSVLQVAALTLGKTKLKPEQIDHIMNPAQPIMLDIAMTDAQRLKFAESFARAGQLPAQDYQTMVAEIKFPPKAIEQFRANPESLLTVPEKEWPAPLRRAAALRAIAQEDNNSQKAHIITAAMAGLTNADLLGPLGDALLAEVSTMAALPDNLAAAPAMARLLLLRGNPEGVNWWRLASASPANREALLPIFPLALLHGAIKDDDRNAWFEQYGRTQLLSGEKKSMNLGMIKVLGVVLPSDVDSQLAAQSVFPAMNATDKRMDVLMNNLMSGTGEAVMRALIAFKALKLHALAEKLVLLNL